MLYVDGVDGIGWLLQVIGILRNVVRKKTGLCGKNSQLADPLPPFPQFGNVHIFYRFFAIL